MNQQNSIYFHYQKLITNLLLFGCFVCLLAYSKSSFAQSNYLQFATQTVEQRLLTADATLPARKQAIETYINNFNLQENLAPITIPVVFHVLQSATSTPITKEQLLAQIAALNQDFAGQLIPTASLTAQAADFVSQQALDIGIQFCLAQSIQETGSIEGIVYKTSEQNWTTDDALKSETSGGLSPWNPNHYLNIWIADLADNITGYAQMPGGPIATDGIVIHTQFLTSQAASKNHLNRIFSHLMGSYLGLYELWQPNCRDDFCADTPIHNAPNFGCEAYKHISFCPPHQAEMTMNFMDMGTTECTPYMFTLDQSKRMHAILSSGGPRAGLISGALTSICSEELVENSATQRSTLTSSKISEAALQVQLNPNPAQTDFSLTLSSTITSAAEVVVYNNLGQLHYEASLVIPTKLNVSTQNWATGIYYIFIRVGQQAQTHQLVILPN